MTQQRHTVPEPLSPGGLRNFADTLRAENTGAVLLLAATVVALVWANSPWRESYAALSAVSFGPAGLHLDLTVAEWAKDGLLAIFFFVVGLELKREIVDGQLRRPATAVVPIVAAVGGMAAPAAIYVAVTSASGAPLDGWAIPVATDIAFAVAVLSGFGRRLPTALRAFLLTLAVVDDLLGIVIIAAFYSAGLAFVWLGASLATAGVFAVVVRRRTTWWLLVPLGVLTWTFMHMSGIHATIAGVILGFAVPGIARAGEVASVAERVEHVWRPVSAGVAVPVFALFAAGVALDPQSLAGTVGDPVAQGVVLGLVLGKPVGIVLATWAIVSLTRATLHPAVRWLDVLAVACVAGIGFTVALLIAALSFAPDSPYGEHVKAGVLIGSFTSAVVGAALLAWRSRVHTRLNLRSPGGS